MSNTIIISICWLITLFLLFLFSVFILSPYLDKKNDIKYKEIKNKKYEIFNTVDLEKIDKILDDYLESYVNRYIVYKFVSKKIMYIKQEDVELMIKDLTKLIALEIPEIYIYYFGLKYSINEDEDLLKHIHSSIMNKCVESVSSYNSSMNI